MKRTTIFTSILIIGLTLITGCEFLDKLLGKSNKLDPGVSNTETLITNVSVEPNPFSPNGDAIEDYAAFKVTVSSDTNITVVITNSNQIEKKTIHAIECLAGINEIIWDGLGNENNVLEAGDYTYYIIAERESDRQVEEGTLTIAYPLGS